MVMCVDRNFVGGTLYYRYNLFVILRSVFQCEPPLSHPWIAAAEDPRAPD